MSPFGSSDIRKSKSAGKQGTKRLKSCKSTVGIVFLDNFENVKIVLNIAIFNRGDMIQSSRKPLSLQAFWVCKKG